MWTLKGGSPQLLAMSASLRLPPVPTAASAASLSPHPLLSSPGSGGGERGRKKKGMAEMNMRPEEMKKPIHQAPTQRASLGVMVTLSGGGHKGFQPDIEPHSLRVMVSDRPRKKNDHRLIHYWLKSRKPVKHTHPCQHIQCQHTVWHKRSPPGNQICVQ